MIVVRTMAIQIDCFRRRRLKVKPRINTSPKEASAMEFVVELGPSLKPIAACERTCALSS